MRQLRPSPTPEDTARGVVIIIGQLRLALPQQDVHTLEPMIDIQATQNTLGTVGLIQRDTVRWPIYCLSAQLELMRTVPDTRRVSVLLKHAGQGFGLLCDEVFSVSLSQIQSTPLPACMFTQGTPVLELALHNDDLLCISSTGALMAFLDGSQCGGDNLHNQTTGLKAHG